MRKTCLNGWWDFYPVYIKNENIGIPAQGWFLKSYLVPSLWRKSLECVKSRNEKYFRNYTNSDLENIEDLEFLYDDFNYPNKWTLTKEAWVRTYFNLDTINKDSQYMILLDAVMPYSKVYINSIEISFNIHPTLPNEVDVTEYIKKGTNELILHIFDYEKDEHGRYMTPTGTMMVAENSGIWQDVFLIEQSKLHINDCFIKTFIDDMRIEAEISIKNYSSEERNILLKTYIRDKKTDNTELIFDNFVLSVKKQSEMDISIKDIFQNAVLWEPSNPKLYTLIIEIYENGILIENFNQNFGFRQISIANKHVLLNNKPIHLFSDWGHKVTTYCYTKEWISSWFDMLKNCNMNHSRLHTCPHPQFILDMADEKGILITAETGLHGSGGYQASNSEAYWKNAKEHIQKFIKRDRNHPSLIMWSVENEMRWNQKGDELLYPEKIIKNLPELRTLINKLDPTRPAYHEGDSSLWDETDQQIISRHYGKDAVGADWWDETKPLHVGEMALYHYEGPNTAINLIGDKAYIDHRNVDIASAYDAKMIIEYGRTRGVCCYGPWNQSCLKLIRTHKYNKYVNYADYSKIGIKPLVIRAHTSEFNFWRNGKNYSTQKSFEIQKQAFRPFAIVDYSLRNGYYANEDFERTVHLVNDTPSDVAGILTVWFGEKIIDKQNVFIKKGYVENRNIQFHVNSLTADYVSDMKIIYEFKSEKTLLDRQTFNITVYDNRSMYLTNIIKKINRKKIVVYGNDAFVEKMHILGIKCVNIQDLNSVNRGNTDIVIFAKNSVHDNDDIHLKISTLLSEGIRIVLMEQIISIFKDIKLINKPVLTSFKTNSLSLLKHIKNDQLRFWGDDPYVKLTSNSYVASYLYEKSDIDDDISYLLETGEGSFGRGDLSFSPLLMLKYKNSLLIANQMNITDKINIIPQADSLFIALLNELCSYSSKNSKTHILDSNEYDKFENIKNDIKSGEKLVINNLNDENISLWNSLLDIDIKLIKNTEIYNCRIRKKDNIVESISNYELNGINTFSYCRSDANNYNLCDFVIEKNKNINTIVESCENSMMKELFVHGGHTELRRAYTISKYFYSEPKKNEYAVVASVIYGKGLIYFNQFKQDINHAKHKRMLKRLIYNLKGCLSGSVFDYEKTSGVKYSEGFPKFVNVSIIELNDKEWSKYVATTKSNNERMAHKKTVSIGKWTLVPIESVISNKTDIAVKNSYLITFNLYSNEPRKNTGSNLGVPNPEDLTFLHITCNGEVKLAVNGQDYGNKNSVDNICIYSDITLEKGINYVMISWTPDEPDSTFGLTWKNINMKPESNLEFFT